MIAPVLHTARLTLSPPTVGDFDDIAALRADPEVLRYMGAVTSTREESWARLLRYAGCWALRGFGFWVVRDRESGRHVGDVGLLDGHRQIEPAYEDSPEAGWALARWCHGRGYATEAVTAALAWADANVDAARVVCMIEEGNAASFRVAEKCGFSAWTETTYQGSAVRLLERRRGR